MVGGLYGCKAMSGVEPVGDMGGTEAVCWSRSFVLWRKRLLVVMGPYSRHVSKGGDGLDLAVSVAVHLLQAMFGN